MAIRIIERFKGWRRKETMIKGATRGRVFVKKDADTSGSPGQSSITVKPKSSLTIKVTRADGSIEHYNDKGVKI